LRNISTRIQKDIKNTDFKEIGSITCSFGISEYRDSENELLSRVDKALYLAKERGRNRIEIL